MVARMDMPPHVRAAAATPGHRFAAYPQCSKDIAEGRRSGNGAAVLGLERRQRVSQLPTGSEVARPFLPTRDFEVSKRFYEALGFEKLLDGDVAIFKVGASSFILQRRYQDEWAENCMMQLMVDNVDSWWSHITRLDLPRRFG